MDFAELLKINVSSKIEKKVGQPYLSWTWAWSEFKKACPDATYKIIKQDTGLPFVYDPATGYMVFTTVTVKDITHEMWLFVMNGANKAMKTDAYTYTNNYNQKKTVEAASMFDINKTLMRCLTKNIAMFGLGLYIYAGEDLPEPEPINSSDQVEEIRALIEKSSVDEATFLKAAKVKNIEDITPERLPGATSYLLAKAKKNDK